MGTVHLTNGHHGLYIRESNVDPARRVLLTNELLEQIKRPILPRENAVPNPMRPVVHAALSALMNLRGFNAAVSYGVAEVDGVQHIVTPDRAWGEISLGEPQNVILAFSHDSRYHNHPFRSLLQWLEEDYPAWEMDDGEYARFCAEWSSTEKWQQFFEDRIRRKVETLRSKAAGLRNEAHNTESRAEGIEMALG